MVGRLGTSKFIILYSRLNETRLREHYYIAFVWVCKYYPHYFHKLKLVLCFVISHYRSLNEFIYPMYLDYLDINGIRFHIKIRIIKPNLSVCIVNSNGIFVEI